MKYITSELGTKMASAARTAPVRLPTLNPTSTRPSRHAALGFTDVERKIEVRSGKHKEPKTLPEALAHGQTS